MSDEQQTALPPRGNFPHGPRGETREQRRERYEQWVLGTRAPQPDYEWQSINFYRGKTRQVRAGLNSAELKTVPAQPSRRLCVNSACWRCEGGGSDANAQERIGNCAAVHCGLHPGRPYQVENAGAQSLKAAIRNHCLRCSGESIKEVHLCTSVTCPVWPVRPVSSLASGAEPAEEPGAPLSEQAK